MNAAALMAGLGFAGFELLRIYRKMIDGKKDAIPKQSWLYLITIIGLIIFSGGVAWGLNITHQGLALYMGFSLPCSLKAFMKERLAAEGIDVDDVEIESVSSPKRPVIGRKEYSDWLKSYLRF